MTIEHLKSKLSQHEAGLATVQRDAAAARRRVADLDAQLIAQHGSIATLKQLIAEEEAFLSGEVKEDV